MRRKESDMMQSLAELRVTRSAGRLARVQVRIDDLQARAEALRRVDGAPVESVTEARVRDKWAIWRAGEVVRLNGEIARLEAQAQPLREANARDRARRAVLARLLGGPRGI
ncbi:MAG: hypothetical protein AAF919_07325 [Pseudomonadota bacterium]